MDSCINAFSQLPKVELAEGLALLVGEHVPLREKIDGLLSLTLQLKSSKSNTEKAVELKNKVSEFKGKLVPHSEREEEILFPMLGTYIGTESGPIVMMEYEHEQAHSLIDSFLEKAEGSELFPEEIKADAEKIEKACNLLKEHFSKEELVLYPMAERMLSADEKSEILDKVGKSLIG